jgi:hypothetical protein
VENILKKILKTTLQRYISSTWLTVMLLAVGGALNGCAGLATGRDASVYSNLEQEEVASQGQSEASALVVIRYPAMIHANAENLYVSTMS